MELINQLWDIINDGRGGKNTGIKIGLPKLDRLLGGIQPSRYYLIAAGTSVGKTAFVIFLMYNILKNIDPNKPVYFLYYSLELGSEILLSKLMALYCAEEFGIYLTTNDTFSFEKPLNDYQYDCLKKAKEWLESISQYLIIKDESLNASKLYKLTIETLEEIGLKKDKSYTKNKNIQLIGIIDHIALLHPGITGLKSEIDLASAYMLTLKRKYKMSWFVLSQQNRDASSMDRRKAALSEPSISDIKDSGNTAQDADVVIQLFCPYREQLNSYRGYKILGDDGLKDNFRSLIITKNRYGLANKRICCAFYGAVGWFKELPKAELITDFLSYANESQNIPCKEAKKLVEEDSSDKEDIETNYNF